MIGGDNTQEEKRNIPLIELVKRHDHKGKEGRKDPAPITLPGAVSTPDDVSLGKGTRLNKDLFLSKRLLNSG